jgi:hypothetical protein
MPAALENIHARTGAFCRTWVFGAGRPLLANLAGKRIRTVWTRQLRTGEVTEMLRRLCFVML